MRANRRDQLTRAETRAREALRGLEPPRAEAGFRARLKREFVSGALGERPAAIAAPARRPVWAWALVPVAAALVVALVLAGNRAPEWSVVATRGGGMASLNGAAVPLGDDEQLGRGLRPGAQLTVPDQAEVELASTAGLAVQVTAGTEFTLPAMPGRWFGRSAPAAVRHGEIRVTTGPRFRGGRLRIDTPEAEIEVTGTTIAVICEPAGTCVCVHEGVAKVGPRGGAMEEVPAGRRRYVFNDGRPPESAGIRPLEVDKLGAFRDRRRPGLERHRH